VNSQGHLVLTLSQNYLQNVKFTIYLCFIICDCIILLTLSQIILSSLYVAQKLHNLQATLHSNSKIKLFYNEKIFTLHEKYSLSFLNSLLSDHIHTSAKNVFLLSVVAQPLRSEFLSLLGSFLLRKSRRSKKNIFIYLQK
jgi:hypothetical protein